MYENSENLNSQAIELASIGEYKEAVACLMRALAIDTSNYLLWYNLGITYRTSGDFESAKEALIHASVLMGDAVDDEIYEALGLAHFALEDDTSAESSYENGLKINNNNASLWNNLGVLYFTQGRYESACESFEQAVTIFPLFYDALYNLRDTYEQLGNKKGATICSEKLKSILPPEN